MQKEVHKNGLDPQALFFDSESRGVAASAESQDNVQQANYLAMQATLMKAINHIQTTAAPGKQDHDANSFTSGGVAAGKHSMLPPEVSRADRS